MTPQEHAERAETRLRHGQGDSARAHATLAVAGALLLIVDRLDSLNRNVSRLSPGPRGGWQGVMGGG